MLHRYLWETSHYHSCKYTDAVLISYSCTELNTEIERWCLFPQLLITRKFQSNSTFDLFGQKGRRYCYSACLTQSPRPSAVLYLVAILKYIPTHDDVTKWKYFLRYWSFLWEIHRSPVNFPHKGQWSRAFMIPLICTWTNGRVNNRGAGDFRRHREHYDVTVMSYAHASRFVVFVVVRQRENSSISTKINKATPEWSCQWSNKGCMLLNPFRPFGYFPIFFKPSKHALPIAHHFHICQMSLQFSWARNCIAHTTI